MREFNYVAESKKLLTPETVQLLTAIHEHNGKQKTIAALNPDELKAMIDIAMIQSTGASNRIEGIFTNDKRLEEIVKQKSEPHNRSEQEIAGYREVLATIHENYNYIPVNPNVILQLHRDLYSYSGSGIDGSYKNSDNVIAETDSEGNQKARFIPVSAFQTPVYMESICRSLSAAWNDPTADKLLIIPMFILDFLCIHPFNDGNGRMSRLLTLLLLYKADYDVGKYISLELQIEKSKKTYYEALQDSSSGWHESNNSYKPFVNYSLGVIIKTYKEFDSRVEYLTTSKGKKPTKSQRITAILKEIVGTVNKKEILERCPDISSITVERTLANLVKKGVIKKVGSGSATAYVKTELSQKEFKERNRNDEPER